MSIALFLQHATKENTCPECGHFLNVKAEDGKIYRFCLSCGHQHELIVGGSAEGSKDGTS